MTIVIVNSDRNPELHNTLSKTSKRGRAERLRNLAEQYCAIVGMAKLSSVSSQDGNSPLSDENLINEKKIRIKINFCPQGEPNLYKALSNVRAEKHSELIRRFAEGMMLISKNGCSLVVGIAEGTTQASIDNQSNKSTSDEWQTNNKASSLLSGFAQKQGG